MIRYHPLGYDRAWPVRTGGRSGRVGSYGYTRYEADGRTPKHHDGIDWLAEVGTAVFAAHEGVLVRVGEQAEGRGYGQRVYLRSMDHGALTIYAHLAGQVHQIGDFVRAGDLLGWVGRSGNVGLKSAIPTHLHFEVKIGESPGMHAVDPVVWLQE